MTRVAAAGPRKVSRWIVLFLALIIGRAAAESPFRELPVWLEESHAGSFYFFASTLPLDEPVTLILVDAHSDASGQFDSDRVRAAIRQGPVPEAREAMFTKWRARGAVQPFDWIEPLMPRPFDQVLWLAAPALPPEKLAAMTALAGEEVDGHAEAAPRECGLLAERWRAVDLAGFRETLSAWPPDHPVAASIDLDYFAETPDAELARAFDSVLDPILDLRGLRALSFCVSSPWLKTTERAERLMTLALERILLTDGVRLRFEPFAECGPDKSLKAGENASAGREQPRFSLTNAGPELRSLLLPRWTAGMTRIEPERRGELLREWSADPFAPLLSVPGMLPGPDGFYHISAEAAAGKALKVSAARGGAVAWEIRESHRSAYAMIESPFDFAAGAPRWPRARSRGLGMTANDERDSLTLERLRSLLPAVPGGGTLTVRASVSRDGERRLSAPVTLRFAAPGTTGFRAALSEQCALPYLFGCTWLRGTDGFGEPATGPETGHGADCANLLIAAWRAEGGWRFPWGGPGDLRRNLTKVECFTPEEVEAGIGIDLDTHFAALWDDRAPLGVLNPEDIVMHQLNGPAALVPLAELMPGHPAPVARRPEAPAGAVRLCFGGDVMLGRRVARDFPADGPGPLTTLHSTLSPADWTMVNLECPLSEPSAAVPFAAPPSSADWLKAAGIDAVSLANNHAGDAGAAGEESTRRALQSRGLSFADGLAAPLKVTVKGLRLWIMAWYDDGERPPPPAAMDALAAAAEEGYWPVVFAHW